MKREGVCTVKGLLGLFLLLSTSFLCTSQFFLLVDERVGHDAQLLNLSALLLGQVLHGLLGVKARPAGAVAVDLPLVLPGLERTLERLVVQRWQKV